MEDLARLAIFFGIIILMMLWELLAPRRQLLIARWQRWLVNFSLSILAMLLMRISIASGALWMASQVMTHQWGLLNVINLPNEGHFFIGIVLLDLAIYLQHRASHRWKWLWKLHQVHHTDLEFDVSTAIRFHPFEIALSMGYKMGVIVLIGASPMSVMVFEILLSSCALFNHSNIKLPLKVDKILRIFLVTPDMHRVHHSVIKQETDSNYGFSISLWDRVFKSYVAQPHQGHLSMNIGLPKYRHINDLNILQLLAMPFKRD